MRYRVKFVPDHLLNDRPWLICRHDDQTTLYLSESASALPLTEKERQLEAAWEGYRNMTEGQVCLVPAV